MRSSKRYFVFVGVVFLSVFFFGCKKNQKAADTNLENVTYPSRIVALSPAAVEILFSVGAGDQVFAVSDFTDYPEEATKLPVVGGFDGKTLSMESILSFKPDLVYLTNGMHNFMISQLEEYGIEYYVSIADSIEEVETEILEIGEITGHAEKAKTVVEKMKNKIDSVYSDKNSVSAYYEVWNAPYMSCGNGTFINDILSAAGYKNIFDDVEEAYPIVSEETIIARNPDYIFIAQSSGLTVEDVCNRPGWEKINAVVNKNIYVIDDNLTTRPGPRIADAVEMLGSYEKK